jgi:hypothetical protein
MNSSKVISLSMTFLVAGALRAQQVAAPAGLTLSQAEEQINAAAAGIQLARTAYLPDRSDGQFETRR